MTIWAEIGFAGLNTNVHPTAFTHSSLVSTVLEPGFSYSGVEERLHTCVIFIDSITTKWSTGSNQSFKVRKSKYHLNESPLPLLEAHNFL